MKAYLMKQENYYSEVKISDIRIASKDEIESLGNDYISGFFRTDRCFYIAAVMTIDNLDLPRGSQIMFSNTDTCSFWYVFAKSKATHNCCFNVDKYTEDEAELKLLLREWVESQGIKIGE